MKGDYGNCKDFVTEWWLFCHVDVLWSFLWKCCCRVGFLSKLAILNSLRNEQVFVFIIKINQNKFMILFDVMYRHSLCWCAKERKFLFQVLLIWFYNSITTLVKCL